MSSRKPAHTNSKIIKVATYSRTSYYDREHVSLASQMETCRAYCDDHGYVVVAELSDENVSGADMSAPDLERGLELARAGQIDVLVTRELDRFARDLTKQLLKEHEFASAGVTVEYILADYEDTPEGQLTKRVRAIIAEYERAKTHERTERGRLKSIRDGNVYTGGWSPFGYRIGNVDGKRVLVVHDEEAAWVRQMFEWYTRGDGEQAHLSLNAIARKLSGYGVPTAADAGNVPSQKKHRASQWQPSSVRIILKNSVHVGQWRYRTRDGKTLTVPVEPIVDQKTFDAAQRQMAENVKMSLRNTRHNYLLRGRIFCECGYRLAGMVWYNKRKTEPSHIKVLYYRCEGSRPNATRSCSAKLVRANRIESAVWGLICDLISDPDELAERYRRYRESQVLSRAPAQQRVEQIDRSINEHKARLRRLLDLYLDGEYNRQMLRDRRDEIEAQIATLESERVGLVSQINAEPLLDINGPIAFTAEIGAALDHITGDFARQRWVIDRLDIRVVVASTPDGPRQVTVTGRDVPLGAFDYD